MKLRRLPNSNSTAGYTLLELLAIVVIVAVLAAIAAPSWLAYATRQRVGAVESDLAQVFQQAQETAISQRRQVRVEINGGTDIPTVTVDGNAQEIGPNELRPDMVILEPPAATSAIVFDYQGTVRDSPGVTNTVPFIVEVRPGEGDNIRHCVVVATLLGNIKTANSEAECDAFIP